MADHLTREQLKRNELGEALEAGIHYAEDHVRTILTAIGAIAVAALGIWAFFVWSSSRRAGANELLTEALRVVDAEVVATGAQPDDPAKPTFASEAERDARARELFAEVDDRFGSTSVGRVAKLYLAKAALDGGDAARARQLWEEYLEKDDRSTVAASVWVNLFDLDRAEGKGEALAERLRGMLEDPARPLPADLLLYQLALTYERLGRPGDATATYRRIVDEHPQSPYFTAAQQEAGSAPAGGPA